MITEHLREPILCAVSGGVDSMYMLCRLQAEGWQVEAAHFNHGLRGLEADRDEAFVREFCRAQAIPFHAGRGDVSAWAAEKGLGTEEAARELRYAFLEQTADEISAGCIATAHTADDNAETLLFHLARGTGLRGLGGIPPKRGRIVRPILDETRQQAEAWLSEKGIAHAEDSTNASNDYARNRIRHRVTPVLKEINSGFVQNVSRTARLLRRDEAFLQSLAEEHLEKHGADADALAALPEPVAVRVLQRMADAELSEVHLQALLQLARKGGAADLPGLRVERVGKELVFDPAPVPPLQERELNFGETELPEAGLRIRCREGQGRPNVHTAFTTFSFPRNAICGKIKVGPKHPGDRMRPWGRGCSKSLKQLFAEAGVTARQRPAWPVLRDEAGLLAVYKIGADERVRPEENETEFIEIEFVPLNTEDKKQ